MMKIKYLALLCFFLVCNLLHAQKDIYHVVGVQEINLKSKYFDFDRKIWVRLPSDYSFTDAQDYDVTYIFDAQVTPFFELASAYPVFLNEGWFSKGTIVVGICSPQDSEYNRREDFLPDDGLTCNAYKIRKGYSDKLMCFVKDELMPYIRSHYRTTEKNLAIGHSLGASFLLQCLLNYDIFNDYFLFSPNLAFGKNMLANKFVKHSFDRTARHYLFFSDAAEEKIKGWEGWQTPRDEVYRYIDSKALPNNIVCRHKSYPESEHFASFPLALQDAYKDYFAYREAKDAKAEGEVYAKHIEVIVDNPKYEVYICGNQASLGNWDAKKIKMTHVNDSVRAIDVKVQLPAQFKFTRGSWETEGFPANALGGINLRVDNKSKKAYVYKVSDWADK